MKEELIPDCFELTQPYFEGYDQSQNLHIRDRDTVTMTSEAWGHVYLFSKGLRSGPDLRNGTCAGQFIAPKLLWPPLGHSSAISDAQGRADRP